MNDMVLKYGIDIYVIHHHIPWELKDNSSIFQTKPEFPNFEGQYIHKYV